MYPGPRPRIYSPGQLVVLTIIVLLIIVSSAVLFYSAVNYQIAASNATTQAIATGFAQITTQVNGDRNPYPPYTGNLALNDPLNDNSQGHNWDVHATPVNNNCQFAGRAYQSTSDYASKNLYSGSACFAQNTDFSNFTFQVQAILVKGLCGGIVFRGDSKANNFDRFVICSNAWYDFRQCSNSYCDVLLANGPSPAINTQLGMTNTLAVVANGAVITIYVNGKQVVSTTDSGFSQGQIGLVTSGYGGTLTVAMFRNAEVWTM